MKRNSQRKLSKKKKRGSGQEKGSGQGRETYVFFYLALPTVTCMNGHTI